MNIGSGRGLNRSAIVVALLGAIGCQSATEVYVSNLQGTWVASEARIENLAGYKLGNVDLIGLDYEVTFASPGNGDFTIRLDPPEGDSEYITGILEIDGTSTTVTTTGSITSGEVFYQDEQAALSMTAGLTYDFSGNGQEVPAKLLIVMERVSTEALPL
ncbi:MAG: hypothetical protein Q8W46_00680 [Candidatus Palauibacterales bacterium]|jgi:hypothetical protein|nr:hypothetical protein [Candidatus Palauibacterales bacterium]